MLARRIFNISHKNHKSDKGRFELWGQYAPHKGSKMYLGDGYKPGKAGGEFAFITKILVESDGEGIVEIEVVAPTMKALKQEVQDVANEAFAARFAKLGW